MAFIEREKKAAVAGTPFSRLGYGGLTEDVKIVVAGEPCTRKWLLIETVATEMVMILIPFPSKFSILRLGMNYFGICKEQWFFWLLRKHVGT